MDLAEKRNGEDLSRDSLLGAYACQESQPQGGRRAAIGISMMTFAFESVRGLLPYGGSKRRFVRTSYPQRTAHIELSVSLHCGSCLRAW
jgi:hypothetical protein